MAFLELDIESVSEIDRKIEDLIEPVIAGTADCRIQMDYATLSAMRVRQALPPQFVLVEEILRAQRRR